MMSWGYLIERGDVFNMNLRKALSRVPGESIFSLTTSIFSRLFSLVLFVSVHWVGFHSIPDPPGASPSSSSGSGFSSPLPLHVVGRIVLNVWRLMRHEVSTYVHVSMFLYMCTCVYVLES